MQRTTERYEKLGVVTDPNMEALLQLKPSEIYVDENTLEKM